jgi:His-Xaa-Ser system radical SAM maturase HxsC
MGVTVTLPLRGTPTVIRGFKAPQPSYVYRLRSLDHGSAVDPLVDMFVTTDVTSLAAAQKAGFRAALLLTNETLPDEKLPASISELIKLPTTFDYLQDGDVVGISPSRPSFRTLYRRTSKHNSFLVTDRCNHYCLMCSQPPKDVDDRWLLNEIRSSIPLIHSDTISLAFTGGEPLLDWREFIDALDECRLHLPRTAIHVLSNGRAFARTEVVDAWAGVKHPNLTVGIPIYSSIDHVHDYIVQARGAFDETILGILRMKNKGQSVEIRVVLHALTAPRIIDIGRWLSRNLPFVDHVALMGLENTGFAIANERQLWIDPLDYQDELGEAVEILASAGMNVSIYNLQRCVISPSVWPYAVQSISDWKNAFLEQCEGCIEKERCSGFFSSGRPRHSRGITPILSK